MIYENPAPYILYYALQLPLVIIAIIIMYKSGDFSSKVQKDGGTKILLFLVLFAAILFPVGHVYGILNSLQCSRYMKRFLSRKKGG